MWAERVWEGNWFWVVILTKYVQVAIFLSQPTHLTHSYIHTHTRTHTHTQCAEICTLPTTYMYMNVRVHDIVFACVHMHTLAPHTCMYITYIYTTHTHTLSHTHTGSSWSLHSLHVCGGVYGPVARSLHGAAGLVSYLQLYLSPSLSLPLSVFFSFFCSPSLELLGSIFVNLDFVLYRWRTYMYM